MRIKIQQMNIHIFSNRTLTDCMFQFIQIKMPILKDLNLEDITYQKVLSKIITLPSMRKTFMTKQLILT